MTAPVTNLPRILTSEECAATAPHPDAPGGLLECNRRPGHIGIWHTDPQLGLWRAFLLSERENAA